MRTRHRRRIEDVHDGIETRVHLSLLPVARGRAIGYQARMASAPRAAHRRRAGYRIGQVQLLGGVGRMPAVLLTYPDHQGLLE